MFFSKFSERDKKEITVEDVILDEFIELLSVVYPSHKPVSGKCFPNLSEGEVKKLTQSEPANNEQS